MLWGVPRSGHISVTSRHCYSSCLIAHSRSPQLQPSALSPQPTVTTTATNPQPSAHKSQFTATAHSSPPASTQLDVCSMCVADLSNTSFRRLPPGSSQILACSPHITRHYLILCCFSVVLAFLYTSLIPLMQDISLLSLHQQLLVS